MKKLTADKCLELLNEGFYSESLKMIAKDHKIKKSRAQNLIRDFLELRVIECDEEYY